MNWKPTGILLAAAAILFALIWTVDRPIRAQRLRAASRIILPGFDPSSVTNIEIKPRHASEIIAVRTEGSNPGWKLTRPIPYPAQAGLIQALLSLLPKLEWQERITAEELKNEPEAQEKYGFAEAQVEIAVSGPGGAHKILIGQSAIADDQVFLEVVGNPDIYLVNTAFLQLVPSDKDQWRDPALLNLAQTPFQFIQVRSTGKEFDLERNPTNNLWMMTNPVVARADTAKVNQLLEQLDKLRARQFVSDNPKTDLEPYGLQTSPETPNLDLSFWQGTNLAAELQMGLTLSNYPDFAFARRQDPSNIVIIPREPVRAWQNAYSNFLDYHLISVSPGSIAAIQVQGEGGERFSVQKQSDGQWQAQDGTTFPVDAVLMRDWLVAFTNITTQTEKTVATDLAAYGLEHPLLRYTLQAGGASHSVIAQIEFGANKRGRIFERRADEKNVNAINPDDFGRLPHAAWEMRDRSVWSFGASNVVSLTIHQQGATREYLRDPNGEWTFAPGSSGPEVNWLQLEEGVHRLGGLRAVYWSGVGETNLPRFGFAKTNLSLSFEVKRGDRKETLEIEFGNRSPYSYPYASVVKDGQRLIFEFPVDLYENFVDTVMTIPTAMRYYH
jgi:hypothetical protein